MSELAPDDVEKVTADIRAVAESRRDDSEVVDLVELAQPEDDQLTADELRDAWPLLDLDEEWTARASARMEYFFVGLSTILRRHLCRRVGRGNGLQRTMSSTSFRKPAHKEALLGLLDAHARKESARSRTPRTRPAA